MVVETRGDEWWKAFKDEYNAEKFVMIWAKGKFTLGFWRYVDEEFGQVDIVEKAKYKVWGVYKELEPGAISDSSSPLLSWIVAPLDWTQEQLFKAAEGVYLASKMQIEA